MNRFNTYGRTIFVTIAITLSAITAKAQLPTEGTWNATTISADQEVLLTGDISLKGTISISRNTKLTIRSNGAQRTIKLDANLSNMFYLNNGSTLELIGSQGDSLVIDGGANYIVTVDDDGYLANRDALTSNPETTNYSLSNPAIYLSSATLNIEYAVIQDVYNKFNGTDNNYKAAAIQANGRDNYVIVKNSAMRRCKSLLGAFINMPNSCKTSEVTFENCDFSYSVATNSDTSSDAGLIRSMGSTDVINTIKNCKIHHNFSYLSGGAIYANASGSETSNCIIDGCEIYMNHARNDGAAIYGSGNMTFKGSPVEIHHNKADRYGGGIGFHAYTGSSPSGASLIRQVVGSNVTVHDNYATEGAGICFISESSTTLSADFEMELNGVSIYDNVATMDGGGFYYRNKNSSKNHTFKAVVTDCDIQRNYAEGGNGGGINILNADVTISGSNTVIANNHSKLGAGFYVDNGILELSDALIQNNIASLNGGGFFTTGTKSYTLNIYNSKFLNNEADQTTANGHGGAFYSKFDVNLENSQIEGNKAYNGGGVYLTGTKKITLKNGSFIKRNFATNGAGIYADGGTFIMEAGNIEGNIATQKDNIGGEGGGVYLSGKGTITISGGSILNNSAYTGGGAFFMPSSSGTTVVFTMTDGDFYQNTATGNVGGGGIYVNGTGTINISGGDVKENKALNGNGGGLYVASKATINFDNGDFQANEALNGGGIALTNGAMMTYSIGVMTGNKAASTQTISTGYQGEDGYYGFGGGIFVASGTSSTSRTTFAISSDDYTKVGIFENTASNGGDDIFADGKYTSFTAPSPKDKPMLSGFVSDGWFEDYVNGDTEYSYGTTIIGSSVDPSLVMRYLEAVRKGQQVYDASDKLRDLSKPWTAYACLRLGYRSVDITVEKNGLKKGESASFDLIDGTSGDIRYKLILTGNSSNGKVSQVFKYLPASSDLTVRESSWGWTYGPASGTQTEYTKDISKEENRVFTFTNEKNGNQPLHGEAIKVNVLKE